MLLQWASCALVGRGEKQWSVPPEEWAPPPHSHCPTRTTLQQCADAASESDYRIILNN